MWRSKPTLRLRIPILLPCLPPNVPLDDSCLQVSICVRVTGALTFEDNIMLVENASLILARNLTKLQTTYIELLETDETNAYTEVGLTLRSYADALGIMVNIPEVDEEVELE